MIKNRELFFKDPTTFHIPNDGTAKVYTPRTSEEWDVLRYELEAFVCEGEYRKGLERVLAAFLANLSNPAQPAVWVSGFYGSGKSHFVRVLEYLWRDIQFPDGASARALAHLPREIEDLFRELSTAGRRAGGLWAASGMLGSGAGQSVRLALLSAVFRSAGLPEPYPAARFVLWLKQNGYYEPLKAYVEAAGKDFDRELHDLYVSPLIANGLLAAYPDFARTPAEARSLIKAQYPVEEDISDGRFLATLEEALELQSETPGKLPLTLLVFDELQQFLGEDPGRTLLVQNAVEMCSSRFGGRLLLVATGQSALQATSQLSKLQGRFTVRVTLSDNDVERVVREVVLRKREDRKADLKAVLKQAQSEIERQLAGTHIGPTLADREVWVADYPLLPARRRFWERLLRAIDPGGVEGQLRTQLRVVHEAVRQVADRPVGVVVPADVIYGQQESSMLQSGALARELATTIEQLNDGTADGILCSRLCALIFLISKLPTEGVAATGLQATPDTLADLLVEDLTQSSDPLRGRIPELLQGLAETGVLMRVGNEYRLQTRESAEWEADFRRRFARIRADDARIASDRAAELRQATAAALKHTTLQQGASKTPRKFELHYAEPTRGESSAVPVWIQDEWTTTERYVREAARAAGLDSSWVLALLPQRDADLLRDTLAAHAAAKECLDARPTPTTPEGLEAQRAMQSRLALERRKLDGLLAGILEQARVFQGGGNEVVEPTFPAAVRAAVEAALVRLFPKFELADHADWGKVVKRAQEGAADALAALGYTGDVDKYPVCQEIRAFVGGAGRKGIEVRKRFTGPGYGWPQDAVDGALLALTAAGLLRAAQNGQPRAPRQIAQSQIGVMDFYSEGVTVTTGQRIAVRKLLADLGQSAQPGEESAALLPALEGLLRLAQEAGGLPPLPEPPATAGLERLRALGGNEQLAAVYAEREALLQAQQEWSAARARRREREPRWQGLQRLLKHAAGLPAAAEVSPQAAAIQAERTLLAEPDPTAPLIAQLAEALRAALRRSAETLRAAYQEELARLTASPEWRLTESEARTLLAEQQLAVLPEPRLSTDEELLATLDRTPLAGWETLRAALPARFEAARLEAARRWAPEAVHLMPPPATLRTREEAETYLASLRAEIMQYIDAGTPVII